MFGNHMVAKEKGVAPVWYLPMDSDDKVSNGTIKVESKCNRL